VRQTGEGSFEATSWFLFLFLPLVPRSGWSLTAPAELVRFAWEPRELALERRETRPIDLKRVLAVWGRALGVLVLSCGPAYWTFLRIHETGLFPAIRLVAVTLIPLLTAGFLDYKLLRVRRAKPSA
jgi:hypothetical protein